MRLKEWSVRESEGQNLVEVRERESEERVSVKFKFWEAEEMKTEVRHGLQTWTGEVLK